jgi:hypothetical protein
MQSPLARSIPHERLSKVDFLLGDGWGVETLYPPSEAPVQFRSVFSGSWEPCERFIKLDFFANVPGLGEETYRALLTWSEKLACYKMWLFNSTGEEPLVLTGDFLRDKLVMISEPWHMPWGLQRMRCSFTALEVDGFEYFAELWEPDGYSKFRTVVFRPIE